MPRSNRQVVARNMLNSPKYFVAAWDDNGDVRFIYEGVDGLDLARMQIALADHFEEDVK